MNNNKLAVGAVTFVLISRLVGIWPARRASFRESLPAQPVGAISSNRLTRQCFPPRNKLLGVVHL
jgi:hypothetical protein